MSYISDTYSLDSLLKWEKYSYTRPTSSRSATFTNMSLFGSERRGGRVGGDSEYDLLKATRGDSSYTPGHPTPPPDGSANIGGGGDLDRSMNSTDSLQMAEMDTSAVPAVAQVRGNIWWCGAMCEGGEVMIRYDY